MNQDREVGVEALAIVKLRNEVDWIRGNWKEVGYVLRYKRT